MYGGFHVSNSKILNSFQFQQQIEKDKQDEELAMTMAAQQEPGMDVTLENLSKIEVEGEEPPKPATKIPRPLPAAPVIQFEEPPEPPPELPGVGVNKKVFNASTYAYKEKNFILLRFRFITFATRWVIHGFDCQILHQSIS